MTPIDLDIPTMQDYELRIPRLIDHAALEHGQQPIITRWADGRETRTDWAEVHRDARKLASALKRAGVQPGARVATLAMNHAEHLVAWFGIAGMGAIIHTINPRLFDDQLRHIVNHAEDEVLFYDEAFQPIVDRLRASWPSIRRYIKFDTPGPDGFSSFIDSGDPTYIWMEGDERAPCMLCYTSGTTGDPKGVLYTHRSTLIHAMAEIQPGVFDLDAMAVVLPIVPMFHAAAWGLPFATAAVGARVVFSASNDPPGLLKLISEHGVTHSAGVPTVWTGVLAQVDREGGSLAPLRIVSIGGSALSRTILERLMRAGIRVNHSWGMTETSPIGTMGAPTADWAQLSFDERVDRLAKQGRVPFGTTIRISDEEGRELPRDGSSVGRLQVKGIWVARRYFRHDEDALTDDGWFDTGDVGTIDANGILQITDRLKDVIKSGGEWISSVELENAAMSCPGVSEVAAVGTPDPRWEERPVLFAVRKSGADVRTEDVLETLRSLVAKWWLPDRIVWLDSLPQGPTGKIDKRKLRELV